jgi:hypothetical protein
MIWYLWVINKSLYLDHRPVSNLDSVLEYLKLYLVYKAGVRMKYFEENNFKLVGEIILPGI